MSDQEKLVSKLKIPESWAVCHLDDISEVFQYGANASSSVSGEFKLLRITDIDDEGNVNWNDVPFCKVETKEAEKYLLKNGDVVIARSGSIGKTAIILDPPPNAIFASYLIRVKFKSSVNKFAILQKYFIAPIFQKHIKLGAKGAAQTNINTTTIGGAQFLIPPLDEQKRIVAKIESTQEKVKKIESSISKAEELIEKYRESLLQKAFRGELVPQDPNDEPASKLIERIRAEKAKQADGKKKKKDDLPPIKPEEIPFEIPKTWEWVRLGEVVESFQNGLSKRSGTSGREIPVLRLADIDSMTFSTNDLRKIKLSAEEEAKYALKKNDIIVIRVNGSRHLVSKFISTENVFGMAFSDHLIRIRPGEAISPSYLRLLAEIPHIRTQIDRTMVSSAGQNTISQGSISDFFVPLPPLPEQEKIVTRCQSEFLQVNQIKQALRQHMERIVDLQSSVLTRAFRGQLVDQDSTEGTGHELIQKIKQVALANENKQAPKSKKTIITDRKRIKTKR